MTSEKVIVSIKSIIKALFPNAKIYLFGSRAKGLNREDSDYDILIVTKKTLPDTKKISFATKIRKALAKQLIDVDLIINSVEEVAYKKNLNGHIVNEALKEAVEV